MASQSVAAASSATRSRYTPEIPESVRIDPRRRLLEIRLSSPWTLDDADSARLAADAGASLLDFASFGAVIVVSSAGDGEKGSRAVALELARESARLGARRVAIVDPIASGHDDDRIGDFELARFEDEADARVWAERLPRGGDA